MKRRKNIRKIPSEILSKINKIKNNKVVVAAKRAYAIEHIRNGQLKHLGITIAPDGSIICPADPILPASTVGHTSKHNRIGYIIVHRELPMEPFFVTMTVPNFGDPSKGYHDIVQTRYRYPRTLIPELTAHIIVRPMGTDPSKTYATFAFQIDYEPDRNDRSFRFDLLHCLNLLLENTGAIDVGDPAKGGSDIIPITEVPWEIFPPGTYESCRCKFFGRRTPTPEEEKAFREIETFLRSLKPKYMVQGGFSQNKYLGALISDDLVVFDCPKLGNALYILHKDWEFISKHSRREILSGRLGADFERIMHRPGWQTRAKSMIDMMR